MDTKKKASTGNPEAVVEPEAEFRAEPAPVEAKPSGKPIPERLRLKREIQAKNSAR